MFCRFKISYYLCTRNREMTDATSLAQQVEHNTFNVGVLGSSPRRITQKKAIILKKIVVFFVFV